MQILASLPPARVAGAMTGGRGDLQDSLLVERLEWLQGWLAATTAADPDSQVGGPFAANCPSPTRNDWLKIHRCRAGKVSWGTELLALQRLRCWPFRVE